jgi:hypothetical protein
MNLGSLAEILRNGPQQKILHAGDSADPYICMSSENYYIPPNRLQTPPCCAGILRRRRRLSLAGERSANPAKPDLYLIFGGPR